MRSIGFLFVLAITYSISAYFFDDMSMTLPNTEWGSMWVYLKWLGVLLCWVSFWLTMSHIFARKSKIITLNQIESLKNWSLTDEMLKKEEDRINGKK